MKNLERQDYTMPTLLQYENVVWYEKGKVRILDRRIYPTRLEFVECETHQAVAQAITDMVTQSAGPYTAAGMGMALAAEESRDFAPEEQIAYLKKASHTIANARPTTANRMTLITEKCVEVAEQALDKGEDPTEAIKQNTINSLNRRYYTMDQVAKYLIEKIPDNGTNHWDAAERSDRTEQNAAFLLYGDASISARCAINCQLLCRNGV